MMIRKTICLALLLTSIPFVGYLAAEDCPVFLLKDVTGSFQIEKVVVPNGELGAFVTGGDSQVLDILLPVSQGVSGSILQSAESAVHSVHCRGGSLKRSIRSSGAGSNDRPARSLQDLRAQEIRVSIVSADGRSESFLISRYRDVRKDMGPSQNLFSGHPIPLGERDYILTTDTYASLGASEISGSVALEVAGHVFAKARNPSSGAEGWFLVDTGGAQSLVLREFLAPGAQIDKAETVQYSSAGRRVLDYQPGGATGALSEVLGHATIPELIFGDLTFPAVRTPVIEELPDIFDRPIVGILGLDQLRRAERVVFDLPKDARGGGRLEFTTRSSHEGTGEKVLEAGFSIVQHHLVVDAAVNELTAHLILDTGAPGPLLDRQAALEAQIELEDAKPVRGLDGGKVASSQGNIQRFEVAGSLFEKVPCRVAELPVLATLRSPDQRIGLLGNAFFGQFERFEIDFVQSKIRLVL